MAPLSKTVQRLRNDAVVTDVMSKGGGHVTFIIDGGYAPDGKARLGHVLNNMPLQRGDVTDAWPISENRMKVQAKISAGSGGFGLGGGL
jgi:hypothetical protein